jgi:hypothetical protein
MTITELLAGIHSLESQQELDAVFEAFKSRSKVVRSIRAAAISLGDTVSIVNITPKALTGLKGTVNELGPTYAVLTLDAESTEKLRWARTSRFTIPQDVTEFQLKGIPKTCLVSAA